MPSLRLEAGVANVWSTRSTSDGFSGVTRLPVVTARRVVAPVRVRADRTAAHRDAPPRGRALSNDRCVSTARRMQRACGDARGRKDQYYMSFGFARHGANGGHPEVERRTRRRRDVRGAKRRA